jgi:hypothetical protein
MAAASRAEKVLAASDNCGVDVVGRLTNFRPELRSGTFYLYDFLGESRRTQLRALWTNF